MRIRQAQEGQDMHAADFFYEGVKAGKLLFLACSDCGQMCHPPSPMCPNCQSLKWEPRESRGRGTVYAWLISKHPSEPDPNPRIVVLVKLEEGIHFISNLQGVEHDDVKLGIPVEVFFQEVNGEVLPQFRPATKTGARQ